MVETIQSCIPAVNPLLYRSVMNNLGMKFRDWLRQEMEASELSQAELARLSKVPQPTIQRILSGETPDPRGSTIEKIRLILGEPPPDETVLDRPSLTADQLMIAEMYAAVPPDKRAEMLDQMARNPDRYKALLDALLTAVTARTVSVRPKKHTPLSKQTTRRKKDVA